MEILKQTPLIELNENIEKSFSPVRVIIKSDEIFNKYMTNPTKVELDFLILSINSNITTFGFKSNLNKWFKTLAKELEIFAQASSVIVAELKNPEWKRVFEEVRMASQNFIYSFYMGNYYTSAVECRKLLEGIIWLGFWGKKLPNRANDIEGFVSQLEDDTIKSLFKYISRLIHRGMPIMNTIVGNRELELINFLTKLSAASHDIIKRLNRVFKSDDLQENLFFSRWYKLIEIYKNEVKTKVIPLVKKDIYNVAYEYEIIDFYLSDRDNLTSEAIINFRNKAQKMIIEEEELLINKYLRLAAIKRSDNPFGIAPANIDKRISNLILKGMTLPQKLIKYIPLVSTAESGMINEMKFIHNLPARDKVLGKYKKRITIVISKLFDIEMAMDRDNMQALFIRRLLEEYFSCICIGKHGLTHPIIKIQAFLRQNGVKLDNVESFKYKHIQKDEGLRYVSNDGVVTGSEEVNMEDVMDIIDKAFNYIVNLPKNNEKL